MKLSLVLLSGAACLALSACSPSNSASDASASVSETAAATIAANDVTDTVDTSNTLVTESVVSSAATVVVTQTETYDPVVIRQMGEKPGYWEVKHTDPKTKKSYVTHVCVDKALGARLARQGSIPAPADHRDYKDDASFKGACPTGVQGGDVQKNDGKKVNAYGDHKPQPVDKRHDQASVNRSDHKTDQGNDHQSISRASPEPSHDPHTTPAEDHANDRLMGDNRHN
jgi:hypothetical protein